VNGYQHFSDHPLFSLENIYWAYRRCRRNKRNTVNALIFEKNLEENLVSLHEELCSRRYIPGRSIVFLVEKPKMREIFAADFRDRVVHHILVGYLEPHWERRFIYDSYACRKEKGTHKGVEQLRSFTRKVTANGTRPAYYLQLDIRGYFITIDRQILYERIAAKETDPAALWLSRTLIFHDHVKNCCLRGACMEDFEKLPSHKTMFKAALNCGLPIGNVTSQFFANVYLDMLDQFVKHKLKAKFYLRYCDDFVLLSQDMQEIGDWEGQIEDFLDERLHLRLNQRRKLCRVSDGINFLGYIVRPDYLLVRRRVVAALRARLQYAEKRFEQMGMAKYADGHKVFIWDWPLIEKVHQWLNSYLAHFDKASSFRLIQALRKRFAWLDEYFRWEAGKVSLKCAVPRYSIRFWHQKRWFRDRLAGHVLVIEKGIFWQIIAERLAPEVKTRAVIAKLPHFFPNWRLHKVKALLWKSKLSVAWIIETGRRVSTIAERALICRWKGTS